MIERLAVDTNALVVWFRAGRPEHSLLTSARHIIVPLPVIGELYAGAFGSAMRDTNVRIIEEFVGRYEVLKPDEQTAVLYGRLRADHCRSDNARGTIEQRGRAAIRSERERTPA